MYMYYDVVKIYICTYLIIHAYTHLLIIGSYLYLYIYIYIYRKDGKLKVKLDNDNEKTFRLIKKCDLQLYEGGPLSFSSESQTAETSFEY